MPKPGPTQAMNTENPPQHNLHSCCEEEIPVYHCAWMKEWKVLSSSTWFVLYNFTYFLATLHLLNYLGFSLPKTNYLGFALRVPSSFWLHIIMSFLVGGIRWNNKTSCCFLKVLHGSLLWLPFTSNTSIHLLGKGLAFTYTCPLNLK